MNTWWRALKGKRCAHSSVGLSPSWTLLRYGVVSFSGRRANWPCPVARRVWLAKVVWSEPGQAKPFRLSAGRGWPGPWVAGVAATQGSRRVPHQGTSRRRLCAAQGKVCDSWGTQRADTEVLAITRCGVGPGDGRCGVGVQRWLGRSLARPELGGGAESRAGHPPHPAFGQLLPRWGEGFDARQRAPLGTVCDGRARSGRTRRSGLPWRGLWVQAAVVV